MKAAKRIIGFVVLIILVMIPVKEVCAANYEKIKLDVPYFPQKNSGDCGISSMSMIEAYKLGYDVSYFDAFYEKIVQYGIGQDAFNLGHAYGNGRYDGSIHNGTEPERLEKIYQELKKGNPILIYRTGGAGDHWSVIVGYNGSSSQLEKSGFRVWNTAHGVTNPPYESDLSSWLGSATWSHTMIRNTGAVSVITNNVSNLTLEDFFYLINKKNGNSFSSTGLLISSGTITEVEIGVKDVNGNKKFSFSAKPNTKYYGLMNADSKMSFSKLAKGKYIYYVKAKDSVGDSLLVEKEFNVTESSTSFEKGTFTTTGQSINHNPQSWLDSATGGNSGFIISGWTFDPDVPTQSLQVDVYIGGPYGQGGTLIASLTANQLREDVGVNYPGVGNYHGFYGEIATDRVGEQPIYVYAINVGEGTENPLIGSSVVNITDTIKPVITNAYVSQKDQDGYTVTATVYDNAGVAQIKFPTKRKDQEGDQYWQWLDGNQNADGSYSCRINLNDFDNVTGGYLTEVRAWDAAGNVSDSWRLPEQFMDKDKPVVTSVEITQADASGYTVTATVTDNVGVAKVQFPTKRKEQEGDQYWKWLDATQNADGSYSCRINISDFDNVTGHYLTEVRAWDAAGNVSDPGRCPEQFYDMSAPRITSGNIISNDKNGYIVSAMIEDDVAVSKVQFAAKLKEQDEQQWKVFEGIKNSDGTYSCKINASDFDNTTGYYLTTAKAWDTYGNVSDVYQFAEQFIDRVAPEIQDIYESKWFEMSSVIEVEATDNVGISDLQLRVRKENANEWQWLTSESTENGKWIFNVDFQKLASGCGSYIAQAVAYDAAGNENVSETRGFTYDPYRWKLQVEMYAVNNNEGRIEQIYSVDKNGYQSKIDWRKFLNPILSDDMVSQAEYVDTLNKYNAEKEQIPTAFEEIDAACIQLTGKENDVHLYWKKLAAEYLNLSGEEKEAYLESAPAKSEAFIEDSGDYFEQYWEIESHNWSEIFEILSTTEELDYYEILAVSQILSEAKIECYLANSAEEVQTIINSVNEFRLAGFPEYIKLVKGEIPESNYFGKVINSTDKNKNSFYGDLVEGRAELINNVLSTEDKEKLDAGKDVKIWMTLNELQNNVSENDKNLIAEKLGEYIIGAYTDITLWKQFDNESEEKISEISGTITIMLELPEELINKNTLKERSYAIIYAHENQAKMIECAVKEDILSFEANEFSTYAIVYKDTIKILNNNDNDSKENSTSSEKKEDNKLEVKLLEVHKVPEKEYVSVSAKIAPTGDGNSIVSWMGTLVLSSLALCTVVISKRKQQNK